MKSHCKECGNSVHARGLCGLHYQRAYRRKTIEVTPLVITMNCMIVGCDRPHRRNKLCDPHSSIAVKYDLTPKELAQILYGVNACQICGGNWNGRWKSPCLDHDHVTGMVRAVVCSACNLALGHSMENPDRLRAIADYIEGWQNET